MDRYVITDKAEMERRRLEKEKRLARSRAIEDRMVQIRKGDSVDTTVDPVKAADNPFIWAVYRLSKTLFETLKGTYVTMLVYLSSYSDYSGHVQFKRRCATRRDLPELLGVTEREVYNFWKAVTELGICSEKNGVVCLNRNYFRRGTVTPSELKTMAGRDTYVTRLYINAVRGLYQTAEKRSRKTLAYLFQILPYVNRQYNIICHNPLEENLNLIQPMTLGQFCDTVGYDSTHVNRLFYALLQPTFCICGEREGAIRYVVADNGGRSTYQIFINPNVYYAGSNWEKVRVLGKF